MDKLAKIAAIAAGLWMFYRWMQPGSQSAAAPAPAPATPTPAASPTAPAPPAAPGLVRPASASAERYTADDWNWFIQQATGTAQPNPEAFGFSRNAEGVLPAVTWDEYRTQRAAAGLAGLVARSAWRI